MNSIFERTAAMGGMTFYRYRLGQRWQTAVPPDYTLSLIGIVLFWFGGVGDMLWHILFGIEENIEALLSPTHLILGIGGGLMITGPLRSQWNRPDKRPKLMVLLPSLLSLAMVWALISFFTSYANAFGDGLLLQGTPPIEENSIFLLQGLGIAGILLQAILMMGIVLVTIRRWDVPFGSLIVLFILPISFTASVHEDFRFVITAILAGVAAELLYIGLKPSFEKVLNYRLFATLLPMSLTIFYLVTLITTGGIWWRIHLWAGSVFLAGVFGLLISYTFLSPMSHNEG